MPRVAGKPPLSDARPKAGLRHFCTASQRQRRKCMTSHRPCCIFMRSPIGRADGYVTAAGSAYCAALSVGDISSLGAAARLGGRVWFETGRRQNYPFRPPRQALILARPYDWPRRWSAGRKGHPTVPRILAHGHRRSPTTSPSAGAAALYPAVRRGDAVMKGLPKYPAGQRLRQGPPRGHRAGTVWCNFACRH